MKKLMIALAFAGLFGAANAHADEVPTDKYKVVTNSFWANWFVSAGFNFSSFYSNQEVKNAHNGPFTQARRDMGFDVAVGKWFTPGLGLRTKVTAAWGKAPYDARQVNRYKYWDLQEQVLVNLSNLFCGYNAKRVWNFIPYMGVGLDYNCSTHEDYMAASFGILNTWRLSSRWNLNLDLSMTVAEDCFDGSGDDVPHAHVGYLDGAGIKFLGSYDKQFTASVGFTYNIGKTGWTKAPDVDAIMAQNQARVDALQSSLSDAEAENARLKDLLSKNKGNTKEVVKKELASTGVSVFFGLNSSKIASKKDLVNVQAVADYAKANGSNVVVEGYADSKTGSADYNQALAQKRAQAVADQLVAMGVDSSKIQVVSNGGVDTLTPTSYNRRAVVTLK
jgi:outer membrane protein OmpA-like peptidoglycan-associated protein/outer membrane protein W